VAAGNFRDDLYYRINVHTIRLGPLSSAARAEDVRPLLIFMLGRSEREAQKKIGGLEPGATHVLLNYTWPGNVRELENVVERAVVLAAQPPVSADVLPEHLLEARGLRIRRDASGKLASDASLFEIVADFERRKIIEQLETSDWSQTAAAEALRIPLSTLNQKIKRLNIEVRKRSA
jgi:DNA-binding NtrC family response regulator